MPAGVSKKPEPPKAEPKKQTEAYKKIRKFLETSPAPERLDFT